MIATHAPTYHYTNKKQHIFPFLGTIHAVVNEAKPEMRDFVKGTKMLPSRVTARASDRENWEKRIRAMRWCSVQPLATRSVQCAFTCRRDVFSLPPIAPQFATGFVCGWQCVSVCVCVRCGVYAVYLFVCSRVHAENFTHTPMWYMYSVMCCMGMGVPSSL